MKSIRIFTAVVLSLMLVAPLSFAADKWVPKKPIKLIVPWSGGGSTDQVT